MDRVNGVESAFEKWNVANQESGLAIRFKLQDGSAPTDIVLRRQSLGNDERSQGRPISEA